MTGQADTIAQAAMNAEELRAVAYADAYYAAEAKQRASEVLGQLGLEQDAASLALLSLDHVLGQLNFIQKKDLAELFKSTANLIGSVAVPPSHVHLVALHEPVGLEADANPPSDDEEYEEEDCALDDENTNGAVVAEDPSAEEVITPIIPHKYNALQRRFVTDLFGAHNWEVLQSLSTAQFEYLIQSLRERYINLTITRLNRQTKESRFDLSYAYVVEGKDSEELARSRGVSGDAIRVGARKMIQSIKKRLPQTTLDNCVGLATAFAPEEDTDEEQVVGEAMSTTGPQSPDASHEEPSEPAELPSDPEVHPGDTGQTEVSEVDQLPSLRKSIKQLAEFMQLDQEERSYLSRIFDPERREVDSFMEAAAIRESVQALYQTIKEGRRHNFTPLESAAFDGLLLGEEPITVRNLRSQLLESLEVHKLRVDQVLSSGIQKILEERERALGVGASVFTR